SFFISGVRVVRSNYPSGHVVRAVGAHRKDEGTPAHLYPERVLYRVTRGLMSSGERTQRRGNWSNRRNPMHPVRRNAVFTPQRTQSGGLVQVSELWPDVGVEAYLRTPTHIVSSLSMS
ncbi:hypothetical protein AMECASPLE_009239, partial [Ameca splendens]